MKKIMIPEMDFIEFSAEDVITTSGDSNGGSKLEGFESPAVNDDTSKSLNKDYGEVFWYGTMQ